MVVHPPGLLEKHNEQAHHNINYRVHEGHRGMPDAGLMEIKHIIVVLSKSEYMEIVSQISQILLCFESLPKSSWG